jgi:hypothetical protein
VDVVQGGGAGDVEDGHVEPGGVAGVEGDEDVHVGADPEGGGGAVLDAG